MVLGAVRPVGHSLVMSLYYCAHLWYTIQHRTPLITITFPLIFQTFVVAQMLSVLEHKGLSNLSCVLLVKRHAVSEECQLAPLLVDISLTLQSTANPGSATLECSIVSLCQNRCN